MKLTGETKLFLGIIITTVALLIGAVFLFSQPTPALTRQDLVPTDASIQGNPNASVFLVEFSDFQCPACKAAKPVVDALVTQYKDKLTFVYRHFPLDQHPFGTKAAQAAEAAGKQGKFWEMYDLLFENQEKFSDELFPQLAQTLKLNEEQFAKDMNDATIKQKINQDRIYGGQIGVNSTPTFFLNGRKLNLFSFNDLKTEVEKAIQ